MPKSRNLPSPVTDRLSSPTEQDQFADDVRAGLTAARKSLPPKYFYDALGSQLFEAICLLPEYYLTRAETEIFERHAAEIIRQMPVPVSLVELGSGSSIKTRLLIEALIANQQHLHYQPIDISATILEQSASKLLGDFPHIRITAQVGDYTQGLGSLARSARSDGERLLVLFLGSNIGNYTPADAGKLLLEIRRALQPGDGLLLGADLKKSREMLEPAYDDALGVTAAFNLNLLLRINRELGADFDLAQFEHRAIYNEHLGCIETYLVSRAQQMVAIEKLNLKVKFHTGETIHTENSCKYDLEQLKGLAAQTGFQPASVWMDEEKRFSCSLWKVEKKS